MIRQFANWMRDGGAAAAAFWTIVGGAIFGWVASMLFALTLQLSIAFSLSFADVFELLNFYHPLLGLIVLGAGIYRAAACHPLIRRNYGIWLAQTPWQYPKPLPLGRIHLVWQDAAVMVGVAVVACLPPTRASIIVGMPWLYPFGYALGLLTSHWVAGVRWPALLAVALLGAVILTQSGLVAGVAAIVVFAAGWWTIETVLRDFPYDEPRRREMGLLPFELSRKVQVHWLVAPETCRWYQRVGRGEAIVGAALIGWMMFAIAMANSNDPDTRAALRYWHLIIAAAAIACRLAIYLLEHLPPISLLGRWKWKRLIVPGYDVVFLAPLAAALTAYLLPGVLVRIGISPLAAFPIATSTTIWLAAALPPDWETWHYTGHYRGSLSGFINSREEVQT